MPINDMDNPKNPMAGMMSLLQGGAAGGPSPSPMQTAMPMAGAQSVPQQAAPVASPAPQQGGAGMNPMIQSLMGQAQQTMNNPMGQPVPQGGGLIDALQHPLVAGIIKALATAAQSYGWTAMMPQERLERTQMQQQKAEALSRLGLGGAEYEGSLAVRQGQLGVNQQKANTAEERAVTADELAQFQMKFKPQQLAEKTAHDQANEALRQKDIDRGYAQINQEMSAAKLRYDAAMKELGPKWAEVQIQDNRTHVMEYAAQLMGMARDQTNVETALKAQQALGDMQTKSWFQDIVGTEGMNTLQGMMGTVKGLPSAPAAPTLNPIVSAPSPVVQQPSTTGGPSPKAKAKGAAGGGPVVINGFSFPNQQSADAYKREAGIK